VTKSAGFNALRICLMLVRRTDDQGCFGGARPGRAIEFTTLSRLDGVRPTTCSHRFGTGRGRATNSPPQFGHIRLISSAHPSQNVHSYVQIKAAPAGVSSFPHFSHSPFIASDIAKTLAQAIFMREDLRAHAQK
jgi:hypothetical protein